MTNTRFGLKDLISKESKFMKQELLNQELLSQLQVAKDHLDKAIEGPTYRRNDYDNQHEIGNLLNAVAQLAGVLEQIIKAHPGHKTIGDVINELATRPDIDIYILERALAKRCYPDRDEYICVEVDCKLIHDSPGYKAERQHRAELLSRANETLERTAHLDDLDW